MKIFLLFVFLTLSGFLSGQNLIGYKDFEIRKYMKDNKGNMSFNKVNNDRFNYLKYTDNSETQTLLFFLGTDSICRSIRIICDSVTKAEKIKEFNTNCKKNGENIWIDRKNGIDYLIEIKDEQWSSIITIKPLK
ncbi:MAG: hypothetical protein IPJ16_11110 [Bacteroidales bacterium]|nr:hypothetical protein [Bacteroidales bacterium]